jgi:hypothetical protein
LNLTNQQKLERLIGKAESNGWGYIRDVGAEVHIGKLGRLGLLVGGFFMPYEEIIFNHDFAKALIGTREKYIDEELEVTNIIVSGSPHVYGEEWELVLMMAVVSPDPISYIYEQVFGEKS